MPLKLNFSILHFMKKYKITMKHLLHITLHQPAIIFLDTFVFTQSLYSTEKMVAIGTEKTRKALKHSDLEEHRPAAYAFLSF